MSRTTDRRRRGLWQTVVQDAPCRKRVMPDPLDNPSGRREKPEGTPESAPPYPYPYHHQPGPSPGGNPPRPYYSYPPLPVEPRNGLGIASLVLAVVALLSVW